MISEEMKTLVKKQLDCIAKDFEFELGSLEFEKDHVCVQGYLWDYDNDQQSDAQVINIPYEDDPKFHLEVYDRVHDVISEYYGPVAYSSEFEDSYTRGMEGGYADL